MRELSFLANAAEPVIRFRASRRKYTDPDICKAYISAMAKRNRTPYKLPPAIALTGKVIEHDFDGMQYFEIAGDKSKALVMYLHGGSYFAPPNLFHWEMLLQLSQQSGMGFLVPLYPRAPLHTVSTAYRVLFDFCEKFKPQIFMGDSAGGGLALGLAQACPEFSPEKMILISPWLDISMTNPQMKDYEELDPILAIAGLKHMGKVWAGSVDVFDPRVSPIYGDFSHIHDLTMLVGTHEIFYPEVMRLSNQLDKDNFSHRLIIGEQMFHVWACFPIKEGREAVRKIVELLTIY